MPITFEIDADLGFIRTTWSGNVTFDDILEHRASLEKRLGSDRGWRRLIDMRNAKLSEVTSKEISQLAHTAAEAFEHMGIVKSAVVAEDSLVYGMMRMFEARLGFDRDSFRVFRNMAQARGWLGVHDAPSDRAFG